ncbi:MAG: hypothetical protein JSR48_03540 [Verrucomicrobia bacterium]|nr:hypothetical protein [Verrucomicrobiota bacterium]
MGKIYVAGVTGEAVINHGSKLETVTVKGSYRAEGSIIETKPKGSSALVLSNGTGLFLDSDSRIEVQKFVQEPFSPNRTDLEVEPSPSQTEALVVRGSLAICTGKLVAGSSLKYSTTLGSLSTQNARLVIEATSEFTRISILDGAGLIRGGPLDTVGRMLHAGEQAVIRAGGPNEPNQISVSPIGDRDRSAVEERTFAACAARKTVYFETSGQDNAEVTAVPVVNQTLPVPITVSPSRLP